MSDAAHMTKLPLGLAVMAAALVLQGCASKPAVVVEPPPVSDFPVKPVEVKADAVTERPPGWSETQVRASARYVRMEGISARVKAAAGLTVDEARLRAGTVVLRRDNADRLLAELARLTKQEVRSTLEVGLALGQPGRAGTGNAEDVTGRLETKRMIAGEVVSPKPEVLVELQVFPVESKDWTLQLEVELAVTTLERFIGYVNEADAGLEPGSRLKLVKTQTGFYKPVFATETTKADVRLVSGDVVLLLSANGERLYFLTATARPMKR